MSPFRRGVLALLVLLFVSATGARALRGGVVDPSLVDDVASVDGVQEPASVDVQGGVEPSELPSQSSGLFESGRSFPGIGGEQPEPPSSPSDEGLEGEPGSQDEAEGSSEDAAGGGLERGLPYVSEGSFFALLGFALGYASRKVVKLALLVIALFFVGLQGLAFAEAVSIDWGRIVQLANDLVLNLKENEGLSEILLDRIPTVGALTGGYVVGFRRG